MNRTHTAAATILLAATLLIGCSDADPTEPNVDSTIPAQQWNPESAPPHAGDPVRTPPRPATALPNAVERTHPDTVAVAALTVWFTWNTSVDTGPNDAAARTAPLLTPAYAREITSTTARSSPGAEWLAWVATDAVLVPEISADDEPTPPQTDDVAYRAYRVIQRIEDVPANDSIVAVVLRRGSGGWEVSRIQDK